MGSIVASIDDPNAHLQMAGTAMAAFDVDGAVAHLSAALRGSSAANRICPPAA
jgi:hypothetical protein